mmetsp:Transcript_56275/g.89332  ORF Transcript_56275/g.89332 Transcript_56275/m.89332 type:complete len:567 (+) Transcript_56275:33-1733(+)
MVLRRDVVCVACSSIPFAALAAILIKGNVAIWENRDTESLFVIETKLDNGETKIDEYDTAMWCFFVITVLSVIVNLLVVVPMILVFFRRRLKNVRTKLATMKRGPEVPEIAAIVPCFLPNEQDIILETVNWILEHVESPGNLSLWVVYNTPNDLPWIEKQLKELAASTKLPKNRRLHVRRVLGSRSKAENLNYALQQVDNKYVVIYDADHHPDPDSLLILFEKLMRKKVDCVQGSTYIRNLNAGLLARYIDAEFFVTHFMAFPALKLLIRNAFFGGSNALWVREVLAGKKFSRDMQTEDIDLSIRSLIDQRKIEFCPEARSGELAPHSLSVFYKQRLRWALGWDQVSLKYLSVVWFGNSLACSFRLRLAHLLYSRWFSQICGAGVITPALGLVWRLDAANWGMAIFGLSSIMFSCFILNSYCTLVEAIAQTHHRGFDSWIQVLFVALFLNSVPFYILWMAFLSMLSLAKIVLGQVPEWVVTSRAEATSLERPVSDGEANPLVSAGSDGRYRVDSISSQWSTTSSKQRLRKWSGVDVVMPQFAFLTHEEELGGISEEESADSRQNLA